MWKQCFECDIKHAKKVSKLLSLTYAQQIELEMIIKNYLKDIDMNQVNPHVMGELWKLMSDYTHVKDPYKEIKKNYNLELLSHENKIYQFIEESDDVFSTALKIAIAGNLIDFSANHTFHLEMLLEMVQNTLQNHLSIDHSKPLQEDLKHAKQLLYVGDNCGEIVLDKIFIKIINKLYPHVKIYYGVRGYPIVNDVTIEDAKQIHMEEVAQVISNGDTSLGTVLEKTSIDFQLIFNSSDVIITKGMGNYEGLLNCTHEHLYFLFMAKCKMISDLLNIDLLSIVCTKKK